MRVFAQDLYTPDNPAINNQPFGGGGEFTWDPLAWFFSTSDLRVFVLWLNAFTVAWCIFYSIMFVADFYFYRMKFSDGDIGREKVGVTSLARAAKLWWTYLICWLFFLLYYYFPQTTLIVVLVYLFKLIVVDAPVVLDIIHDETSFSGVFTQFRNITQPLKDLLSLRFNKKKSK